MKIGDREIGPGHPPYVIAEIGVNHDGELSRALSLTDAAAEAGADAVKLQYFETDALLSKAAKLAAYQKDAGETDPVAMLRRLELGLDEMAEVVERAHSRGIHAIVTVFSVEHVEPVSRLAWDAYKSASPDVINRPLLDALAATGKPMIVSTGASTMDEVVRAREWLDPIADRLAFLQCVSSYPAPSAGLGGIAAIAAATDVVTGYSDHTPSVETGAQAVRAGALVLEKHLTHDRSASGPDHGSSLEPDAMAKYVSQVQDAEMGADRNPETAEKMVFDCEGDVRAVSRQSVTSRCEFVAGETITINALTIKRPGTGIEPWRIDEVVGRTLARGVETDIPLVDADLA